MRRNGNIYDQTDMCYFFVTFYASGWVVKDYQLSKSNLDRFMQDIEFELSKSPHLVVSTQDATTGKWGMARLWRTWMSSTAKYMAANGCTMPLMLKEDGSLYGKRPFNHDDAHELFTSQWLGVDSEGIRLSWAKTEHDGMRVATKSERFFAMLKHEQWAIEKGITLLKPRDSEFAKMEQESER